MMAKSVEELIGKSASSLNMQKNLKPGTKEGK